MRPNKFVFLTLGICLSLTASLALSVMAAEDAQVLNKALMKATAPYEDLVEPALARDQVKIAKYLAVADSEARDAAKALPGDAAKKFEDLRQNLHKAVEAKDGVSVARDSMQIFRLLIDHLKAEALTVPVEVSLMDYAGYELQVLAAAENPDWTAIKDIAAKNDAWWQAIAKPKVSNKQLRASVTSAVRGAQQAAQEKNLSMVKFAAQMILDLVDVLEIQFKSPLTEKPVKPVAPKP